MSIDPKVMEEAHRLCPNCSQYRGDWGKYRCSVCEGIASVLAALKEEIKKSHQSLTFTVNERDALKAKVERLDAEATKLASLALKDQSALIRAESLLAKYREALEKISQLPNQSDRRVFDYEFIAKAALEAEGRA